MTSELPPMEPETSYPRRASHSKPAARSSLILVLALLAFAGGIIATLWAGPTLKSWWLPQTANETTVENLTSPAPADDALANVTPKLQRAVAAQQAVTAQNVATLEARLAAVSAKLDAISEQAAGAGGNAARAEGLLIAFATRRALDRGTPLGYLEGELRLRFGDAQPRAVATIINAAASPVTITDLQSGLDEVTPQLLGTGVHRDWWSATKREIANLIIIRNANAPSPVPQKAIKRAKLMLSTGRVDEALREIERLPDHEKADNWLQMARQYNEARRALDVIEAAAILEPRSVPVTPRAGGPTNMQVAPPPPEAAKADPAQ